MARCTKCGRHGFFVKINKEGFCRGCEAELLEEQITRLKEDRSKIEAQRNDEKALLAEAVARAEKKAEEKIAPLIQRYNDMQERCNSLEEKLEDEKKKDTSLSNRIAKLSSLASSVKYAVTKFPNELDQRQLDNLINDMEALVPPARDLNCLTMKDLRAQYRKIEKQIKELYASYQQRYTTKANATLYKLMVLALSAELELIMKSLSFNKLDDAIARVTQLTARYYLIIADGNQSIAPTLIKFTGQIEYLYIEAVKLEYEYFIRRERAKEEQRAIREQMRQEAAERKILEQQRKKVESEEKKYLLEIERLKAQLSEANEEQQRLINSQINEVRGQLKEVEGKKEEIINLQNGKAGTVYVISNLGAFGDHMFKIGMTRRLVPEERVNELGSASVPFPFDIHSLIFSQDAVSLESELHKRLNVKRVNKVNLRKEFFDVSLDELEELVTEIDPTAPFSRTMAAEQYRLSLSIDDPVANIEDDIDCDSEDDEERQTA